MPTPYPIYVANRPEPGAGTLTVTDKATGEPFAQVGRADADAVAGLVMVSTLMAVAAMPITLSFLL